MNNESDNPKKNTKPFRSHGPIIESNNIRYFNDSYNSLVTKIILPSEVKHDADILLTGMPNVGKKSLLFWIDDGRFVISDKHYMGGSFCFVETKVNKSKRLNLYFDTPGGQDKFGIYLSFHIYDVYLILYDVGNRESFNIVNVILNQINDLKKKKNIQPLIFLIGNKIDEKDKRKVSFEEGKKYAQDNKLFFFEISVKTEKNCYEFFSYLNWQILLKKYENEVYIKSIQDNNKNENITKNPNCYNNNNNKINKNNMNINNTNDNINNNINNNNTNDTNNNNNNTFINKIINFFKKMNK